MSSAQCGFFEYGSSGSEDDQHYQLSVEPRAQQRQPETNTTKPPLSLSALLSKYKYKYKHKYKYYQAKYKYYWATFVLLSYSADSTVL